MLTHTCRWLQSRDETTEGHVKGGDRERHKFGPSSLLDPNREISKHVVNLLTTLNSFFLKSFENLFLKKTFFNSLSFSHKKIS